MPEKILADSWTDYNKRKTSANTKKKIFCCEEQWERDYLRDKIHRIYPDFRITQIEFAIQFCCEHVPPPRRRKLFVECVMIILEG